MPADSGMGFVIVQHLDPTRESMLADILGRETKMPVVQVEDGMAVEPNRVHIIVPAKTLLISGGVLRLVEPEEPRGQRHPIDKFFSSLAEDQKAKAIAIVLSGAGSDGTAGIADIKQAGGMCIAQDPETAKFDSMPRHAIASDSVDLVLAPGMMPEALLRYARHSYVHAPRPEMAEGPGEDGSGPGLGDVLTLLHARAGHDFSQYKQNTLSRRIHRRMGIAHMEKLDDYLAFLARDAEEAGALVKDLLIHVTAFFRDAEAWDALDREVITPIVEKAERGQSIRVWVPACSTGEEAYTIAMILAERGEAAEKELGVKIFATDAAEHHLSAARRATFPGSMVESLPVERIARFFDKIDDNYYRIKPPIRETVLFAPQNLLKDPPYSRMDLVSCRNLLIYLEPVAQEKVLSLAHFALRENGYLFLGNAETVGQRGHLFASVSKRWRIYRRVGPARSPAIDFSQWPVRDGQLQRQPAPPKLADIALRSLAERFAPASVLIDHNYRVLHFHGSTDEYLTQPAGAPTMDLLALAREGLRLIVRSAVRNAIDDEEAVTLRAAFKGRASEAVLVTASPVRDGKDAGMILVSFAPEQAAVARTSVRRTSVRAAPARDLEEELRAAREEMGVTVEQYETTNEELTAANEEVTSINEELQATNEELESSKEELQSLNEELSTINAQLDRKIVELADSSDDLRNLLQGNDVATIFLDCDLRIKWFSPPIRTLFDLIDKDVGRPIANFTQKFAGGALLENATAAIERLETCEQEVLADDGRCLLLRVLPYRTGDNRIAGAVATFIDITDLKSTEA
ncbi:MAG: CheR family methyltransferase, partial [Qipengyuania sp.]